MCIRDRLLSQAKGLQPEALRKNYSDGTFCSPLFSAAMNMQIDLFIPLLKAHQSNSSSSLVRNLLDQECKWVGVNCQLKAQSLREWAKEWEEKGSNKFGRDNYKGLLSKLEDAEKGK